MKKNIKNINGEFFESKVTMPEEVNVMSAGYIITLDGIFIPVRDDEFHNTVFAKYLNNYLINNPIINYSSNEALLGLLEINHIIYYGLKLKAASGIYKNKGGVEQGFLILPQNYKDVITEEQKNSIKNLLNTNKSIFGDREKVAIEISEKLSENKIDNKEFIEFLESNNRKI